MDLPTGGGVGRRNVDWDGSTQYGFVKTSPSCLRERLSVTHGTLDGLEVSTLNFVKVSLCLSHELSASDILVGRVC